MTDEIHLTLPFPPSANTYYRNMPGGRVLISEKGRDYKVAVMHAVLEQGSPQIEGRLDVDVWLYPPDHRKRDIMNYEKAMSDCLQEAEVFANDEQIDHFHIHRGEVGAGTAEVTIVKIGGSP